MTAGINVFVVQAWGAASYASVRSIHCSSSYLQGESNDFETLLHCIKLLFVEGVAHYVRA